MKEQGDKVKLVKKLREMKDHDKESLNSRFIVRKEIKHN